MTGFENEQGLDWEKLIDSKNAYSFFAVLDETANEMKQAVIEEQAKVIIYPKMDKMLYDEIELPQVDGDAVYQVFLFELHSDLQRRVHPSFRMDLKGEKD